MIAVIDYNAGNTASVGNALDQLGQRYKITGDPEEIARADKIIFPGVGAAGPAMETLKKRGIDQILRKTKTPVLGICLGLQLLFKKSDESPEADGLDIYPGRVGIFKSRGIKIPHMGWNSVSLKTKHPLLKGIADGSYFYFVHSYYAVPKDPALAAGFCRYGTEDFTAILGTDTAFATQFHPEKSQADGLRMLRNFGQL